MYRVDYNHILSQKQKIAKVEALEREIAKCDYLCLTDAIVSMEHGGSMMFEYLGDEEIALLRKGTPRLFRLRCLRDRWGDPVKPGDVITRKITKRLRDKAGRKLTIKQVRAMKRRGEFDKQFVETREFVVDDKGCIQCTFDDAGHFLLEHGVHFESGQGICFNKREVTSTPVTRPDGSMKTLWNWLYEECPPNVYDKLPSLTKKRKPRTKPDLDGTLENVREVTDQ